MKNIVDKIHEGEKYKAKNIEEYLDMIKGKKVSAKILGGIGEKYPLKIP